MNTKRSSAAALIVEFLRALLDPHSYSPHKNPETIFGFLWGLPIPIFAFAIHLHATGSDWNFQTCFEIVRENPLYLIFVAHPLFFSLIFGAHGSMRARRDAQIHALIADLEQHCEQLCHANEKLTEVDRLKSEFLANVTHELKSPLVTALGYSERILTEKLGPITEQQRNALGVSKRNLVRLRILIEEILDFSRLEAGVGKFKFEQTSLIELIEAVSSDLFLKARDRNIKIVSELPDKQAQVHGDKMKLAQAIGNLLDNAIKFSMEGNKVRISLSSDDGFWHLQIQDWGTGIVSEDLSRLFLRFSQVDGTISRPYNGVGLGLVIVKKIVEAHNGRVWLESQPGIGTTAHIKLPMPSTVTTEAKEIDHVKSAIG
jgi:signal transduction histidine kinase